MRALENTTGGSQKYSFTEGKQNRKATFPSNSQDLATQALILILRSHLSMCCHVAGVTTTLLGLEADPPAAHCRTWAVDGNLVALIQGWILLPLGFN